VYWYRTLHVFMISLMSKAPIRILAGQKSISALKGLIEQDHSLSVELLASEMQHPGVQFDAALISRDITATSTKQKIIPSTQAFYELLLSSPPLRWVQIHSAGADRQIYLDLMERGVKVTGSSGVNAEVVMQNALAGILMLARHFPKMLKAQAEHRWDSLINYTLPADLHGQTAVIVGRGPIARAIARVLRAIGVKLVMVGFNEQLLNQPHSSAHEFELIHISQLQKVLPQAQWLVLACPLSQQTRELINQSTIDLLPTGAHVINVARGEIICEPDLIAALQSHKLAGAYLDVFAVEPLDVKSPLWDMSNVIVTPHSAGHSAGNEQRVLELFVQNLRLFSRGEPLINQIVR